ncbi:MAG: ribose-phosphate pyrophosphokinase [Candidatus Tyloplasma litorale]|nr:MAG: ribose-phosphate pyrophosphokinase [Mycoplasmatales bacterium]
MLKIKKIKKENMLNENKRNSIIFGLSTSKKIAKNISELTGIKLGESKKKSFADGEIFVELSSTVRNKSVFLIQSTHYPANDNLMELLLFIDAVRRSSAKEVNIVIPYFGYARQDRKVLGRQAISAKLVSNLLTTAGANRIITFDIHSEQIAGFFDIPFDNLKAYGLIAREISKLNLKDLTIVSPDHGGVSRARSLAKILDNSPLSVIDKRRTNHNESESMFVLGDVKNRNIVIFDDMVDTGGTVVSAVKILKEQGAKDIYLAISHAVLSDKDGVKAKDKLKECGIKKIITTNSISHDKDDFIQYIDLSNAIAETIKHHINNKSITNWFVKEYNTYI